MVTEHIGAREHRGHSQKRKMGRHFPDKKVFGKKKFSLVSSFKTKAQARDQAESIRKKGKNARVVRSLRKHSASHGTDKDHKYAVYIESPSWAR